MCDGHDHDLSGSEAVHNLVRKSGYQDPSCVAVGRESSLVFIGGFDSKAAMDDTSRAVSFLTFSYPAENVEDLRNRLGSIDLDGGSTA